MPQVFCILDEGGRSLVVKATGDIQSPSFPTVGLLCSISTYGTSAGFTVETFGTENVRIVYKRFPNHLLFVLATSNKLVHSQQLQTLLQAVYDGLVMLLGSAALHIDGPGGLDNLRKRLRGLTLIDVLIADDGLVPCIMLMAPQVLAMPSRERQTLEAALDKIASVAGSGMAAFLVDGWYMAATREWWIMGAQEALLLQHLAASSPEAEDTSFDVYLSVNKYNSPLTLLRLTLDFDLHLLLLCPKDTDMDMVNTAIDQQAQQLQSILQTPPWAMPVMHQFESLSFDMALLVQHHPSSSHRITLFWGHTNEVPQGFNPLMSPTLKRQLASSAGGAGSTGGSTTGRSQVSMSQRDLSSADNMQLYYRSCVDMLVSFMLQLKPDQGKSGGRKQNNVLAMAGLPHLQNHLDHPQSLASDTSATEDEVQLVTAGNRLVGLLDSSPRGIDIFAAFPRRTSRLEARDCTQRLSAIFQMSYSGG